jgi:S-DNA-T family DNA segregation ATPase FtsK/SpoIIIE
MYNKREKKSSEGNTFKVEKEVFNEHDLPTEEDKIGNPKVEKTKNDKPKLDKEKLFKFKKPAIWFKITEIVRNPKLHYISGWLLIFTSVFLTFAFFSYFLTWKSDYDKIQIWTLSGLNEISEFEDINHQPENFMGSLGAKLSHFFISSTFGIGSFVFPYLFFLSGFAIVFNKIITPIKKTYRILIFYAVLSSSIFALIFNQTDLNLGGNIGVFINHWLSSLIGVTGLVFIQIFLIILSIYLFFNVQIEKSIATLMQKKSKSNQIELNNETEINELKKPNIHTVYPTEELELNKEKSAPWEGNILIEDKFENEEELLEMIEDEESYEEIILEHTPIQKIEELKGSVEFEINETIEEETVNPSEIRMGLDTDYDPTLDLSNYKYPPMDLLVDYETGKNKVSLEILESYKQNIVQTLENYNIKIDNIKATVGPTVTLYEIVPAAGVRIAKIKNLEDDIALSLAALGIRIIAPIPGKGTVGIEVPNPEPDIVPMKSVLSSKKFVESQMELPVALGKTISNETFVYDLAKMPHLLMAGATGQGKSVGLNCILVSLLYKKHPSQLKLVLVDPKKVELTLFNKVVRHFLAKLPGEDDAIITETQKVVNTVNSLCIEMDNRYELLKDANCRNLREYNTKFIARKLNPELGHKFLPYIVLVIDEFADLIMTAGKEVELPIARLAQLARAIGIHLIIATQRPSVNIITGTIKANFPARIAFRVTSKIDSRTILDTGGADQLIGRGDMLFSTGNDLVRIQCAFVDTPEVEEICEFIGNQQGYPDAHMLPEFSKEGSDSDNDYSDLEDRDSMFEEAARIIVIHQQGSASLLQRKLKLGYNRAGRIIDQLEAAGIIGPFEGSKARKVLITDEVSLEQFLNRKNNV